MVYKNMKKIYNIICYAVAISVILMLSAGCTNTLNNTHKNNMSNQILLSGTPLRSSTLQSRAVTAENQKGEKGQGGKEKDGRKGLPCLWHFKKDQVYTFADIDGPGMIRHIWITVQNTGPLKMRNLILRFYWDDQETPSVEVPLSDFFGISHGRTVPYESAFITMPEGRGFNCYFPMPFAKRAKLTVCNETGEDAGMFFYQVDYTVGDAVDEECPYFHAQFRRDLNTTLKEDYVILDGVKGKGRYLGVNFGLIDRFAGKNVWWGEGEVKMYIDGDTNYPTICGTGAEDYFGSGWGLIDQFATKELGSPIIDGKYISCYRFHERDPIYFNEDIKVTIQQLGNDGKYEPADPNGPLGEFIKRGEYKKEEKDGLFERVDDICSTVYWYQTLPTIPFGKFPDKKLRSAGIVKKNEKEKEVSSY
jgi:hypothetical protein